VSKNFQEPEKNNIVLPSDRYLNSYLWYTETEKVWRIFTK
jgi:hypothetical protein